MFSDIQVTFLDKMGSDLDIVNAARTSFAKTSEWDFVNGFRTLKEKDANLIRFLERGMSSNDFDAFVNQIALIGLEYGEVSDDEWKQLIRMLREWRDRPLHWAPFAHCYVKFHVKIPIFLARQLAKHQVGGTISEVSRRYIDGVPELWRPEYWRERAPNVKQGSKLTEIPGYTQFFQYEDIERYLGEEAYRYHTDDPWVRDYVVHAVISVEYYKHLIGQNVCPEQARIVLPLYMMTEWTWSGSLMYFIRILKQRLDSHAQIENRQVALPIHQTLKQYFPVTTKAFFPEL